MARTKKTAKPKAAPKAASASAKNKRKKKKQTTSISAKGLAKTFANKLGLSSPNDGTAVFGSGTQPAVAASSAVDSASSASGGPAGPQGRRKGRNQSRKSKKQGGTVVVMDEDNKIIVQQMKQRHKAHPRMQSTRDKGRNKAKRKNQKKKSAEEMEFDRQQSSLNERENAMEWRRQHQNNDRKKGRKMKKISGGEASNPLSNDSGQGNEGAVFQFQPATFDLADRDSSLAQMVSETQQRVQGMAVGGGNTGYSHGGMATEFMQLPPAQSSSTSLFGAAGVIASSGSRAAVGPPPASTNSHAGFANNPFHALDDGRDDDDDDDGGRAQVPAFQFQPASFAFTSAAPTPTSSVAAAATATATPVPAATGHSVPGNYSGSTIGRCGDGGSHFINEGSGIDPDL